jgi:hypothetical protein
MTGVMQKASIVSGGCYCSLWDSSRLERTMFFRAPEEDITREPLSGV